MARMNLTDMRDFARRLILVLVNNPPVQPQKIIILRQMVRDLTSRYSVYEPIVRVTQDLFNVSIFRNEFNLDEGIYIVGREAKVIACSKWIEKVITRIERDGFVYGNCLVRSNKHGNQAISDHIHKKVNQLVEVTKDLIHFKNRVSPVDSEDIADEILIADFCKQHNVIKTKTKYHGKIRNTG